MQTLDSTVIYRLVLLTSLSSTSFYLKNFWLHDVACGLLVPWPGIEPVPSALEAGSFPWYLLLMCLIGEQWTVGLSSSNDRSSVWLEGLESAWEWLTVYSRGRGEANRWWATESGSINHHRNEQEAPCTAILAKQLLTVPSWRGWCQREYSGVLRKLEFLFWLSFTYEKQTHDRMSHYTYHNKSLSTRHSSSANRGTFWATRWEVPSNTITSLYPFFPTNWKAYILLSVPVRLCNFISRPLYTRFYSQSWVFFETSIKCLWISFKNIFIMSNYPWRLHSLWRGGWWKTMMLFLQMSFAENARSEADQMTSPFQVFFNRWRWKENAKKWILVLNFFFFSKSP